MTAALAKTRKEETRERIVETASRLFQERGVDGVGVDEIMRASGLTHGGFYAHFENKEALVAQACIRAIDAKLEALGALIVGLDDAKVFDAFVRKFLADETRTDSPACPMAMLGAEVARREKVQKAYAYRIRRLIAHIAQELECPRGEAALALSALLGSTMLAAQTSSDEALARQILNNIRTELLSHRRRRPTRRAPK